ncbi:MAG: glycosyltransferase [Myxococcales bacterium]|nr:glycosyltransferase [Myxococcales bacterium]
MKIVDVNEFYAERGGGVRTYVDQKLAACAAAGHELVVIAPGPEDREEARLGGRILWVRSRPLPLDPRYYLLLRERAVHALLAREAPDVIEGSSPWTGGWFAARYRGPALRSFVFHQDPIAVYGHTLLGGLLGERSVDRLCAPHWRYLRALSARYDLTVTSGAWLAERLRAFGLRAPTAVPFGIDRTRFDPARRDERTRRDLLARCGLGPGATLLLCVSRHHPEKRLGTLIDAVARCRDVGLVILGDGPLRPWVERRARAASRVHVAGFERDRAAMATMLASGDALLHGSGAETYGLAVAEGLCAGLPAIVPDRGGAAELATDACTERYRAGDPRACAAAIERLLSRDRAPLRAAALQHARAHVGSIDHHFDALLRLYAARATGVGDSSGSSGAHSALNSSVAA